MRVLLLLTLLWLPAPGWGAGAEGVDHLALAALMIRDGHWERAARILDEADAEAPAERARYWTLTGLVRLHEGAATEAVRAFEQALEAAPEGEEPDPMLHVQLAQAHLRAEQPERAVAALEAGGEAVRALDAAWILRARAERARGRPDAAWEALRQGGERFPEQVRFDREKAFFLVERGLYRAAEAHARRWLERAGDDPGAWLALAGALREGGQLREATLLLEEARLRHPEHRDLLVQLAGTWLERGRPLPAAQLLQQAAELDPAYALEAAELFRRAGDLDRALYMNGRVIDPAEKAKQRLGLLLERGDHARAVALHPRLERLGLLQDDAVAYAVAYAWFHLGRYDRSEASLGSIADPDVFADAQRLRRAMERCREAPEGCT